MRKEKLSNLCKISNGFAFKSDDYVSHGHRVMRITNVQKGLVVDNDPKFIPNKIADKVNNFKLNVGDILVSLTGNVGRVGRVLSQHLPAVLNQRVGLIRPTSTEINDKYLFQFLNSNKFEREAIQNSNGVAQLNLSSKWIENYEIPLPPLDDQIRIAHLLSNVEDLIAQRKQSLKQLDELLKSVFLDMFGDPVRNQKRWNTLPFNKVGQFISGGTPSKNRSDFWDGSFPWVSPKDMKVSKIRDAEDHISESVFEETSLKRISPYHLLIVVRGMILVHSFPVAINVVDISINQDMKAIKPIKDVNVVYLQNCLNSLKRQILKLISSAGHGTRKLDSAAMQKLFVPVPPIELQNQFAAIVEKIESIKSLYQQNQNDLENLYGALSQKAFKGELNLSHLNLPTKHHKDRDALTVPLSSAQRPAEQSITPLPTPETSPVSNQEEFAIIVLPDITDTQAINHANGRQTIITQWLEAYLKQIGNSANFSTEQFIVAAKQKLQDLQTDQDIETPSLDIADYDQIKAWIFDVLASGRITQVLDDIGNCLSLRSRSIDFGSW